MTARTAPPRTAPHRTVPTAPTGLPNSLRYVLDQDGRDTGFAVVREPVRPAHLPAYHALAAGHRMIGLCSLGPFPLYREGYEAFGRLPPGHSPEDGWRRPFVESCQAWCHCFREPDRFLPPGRPRLLFSNSDFTDVDRVWAEGTADGHPDKRWDVVYCCLGHRFYEFQKSWDLAKSCLRRLAGAGLRVLVVGRADSADLPDPADLPDLGLEVHASLPLEWGEFLRYVARARLAFFPNLSDASPRALAEALALDVPVLVNRHILGGWKYVNPYTGMFFDDETDVADAALSVLAGGCQPRAWFAAHFGRRRAEERLAGLLRDLAGTDPVGVAADATRACLAGSR